jgi:hypothetical protein
MKRERDAYITAQPLLRRGRGHITAAQVGPVGRMCARQIGHKHGRDAGLWTAAEAEVQGEAAVRSSKSKSPCDFKAVGGFRLDANRSNLNVCNETDTQPTGDEGPRANRGGRGVVRARPQRGLPIRGATLRRQGSAPAACACSVAGCRGPRASVRRPGACSGGAAYGMACVQEIGCSQQKGGTTEGFKGGSPPTRRELCLPPAARRGCGACVVVFDGSDVSM